jgi:hypothetical protein
MTFNMTQFAMTNRAGETMNPNPDTIQGMISKDQTGTLQPGDCVKLVAAETGALPVFEKVALGDVADGVILASTKKSAVVAKDIVDIGLKGTIVSMAAGTAFNRGDVYYIPTTGYISSTTGVRIGRSLQIATDTDDIVWVHFDPKSA